jgi:hypothetical protein
MNRLLKIGFEAVGQWHLNGDTLSVALLVSL